MFIRVRNKVTRPVSLPGPLPRLDIDGDITTDITPEEYDRIKDELGSLQTTNQVTIELIEIGGSFLDNFRFDHEGGRILFREFQIAPSGAGASDDFGDAVGSIQNLRDVPIALRNDRQIRLVEDVGSFYRFDEQSVLPASGERVIIPTVGSGRWLKVENPASIKVDVANELSTVPVKQFPTANDLILIEDSEDGFTKKAVTALSLENALVPQNIIQIDEVGTLTYVGEATPGTQGSDAAWRIYRVDENPVGDSELTKLYASGSIGFDQIWDNRQTLLYS